MEQNLMKKLIISILIPFFFLLSITTTYAQSLEKKCELSNFVIYTQFDFVFDNTGNTRYSVLQTIVNKGEKCKTNNDLRLRIMGQGKNPSFLDSFNNKQEVHTELIENGTETYFWVDRYSVEIDDSYWVLITLDVHNFSKKTEEGYLINTLVSISGLSNETVVKMTFKRGFWGIDIFNIPKIIFPIPFPDQIINEKDEKILIWKFKVKGKEWETKRIMLLYRYVHDKTTIIWTFFTLVTGLLLKVFWDYTKKKRRKNRKIPELIKHSP